MKIKKNYKNQIIKLTFLIIKLFETLNIYNLLRESNKIQFK